MSLTAIIAIIALLLEVVDFALRRDLSLAFIALVLITVAVLLAGVGGPYFPRRPAPPLG